MKMLVVLFVIFVTTVSCQSEPESLNMESFETVWRTVDAKHFDPRCGGLDWKEVHHRYQPQIARIKTDPEFYTLVNKMLFELNLSHLLVASHDDLKVLLPTLFAEGSIGVDVRLIHGAAVITSVKPETPGAQAGLRPGFVIMRIDGIGIEQIIADAGKRLVPPFNSRNRRNNVTLGILGRIYGVPGTTVSISYLDEQGKEHEKAVTRQSRGRGAIMSNALPPFFIEFEALRLDRNIGYIRFNHFAAPVDKLFAKALNSMKDMQGLIIDLRGNSGGYFTIADTIAEHLVAEKTLFYTLQFRDKTIGKTLTPREDVYDGPVVVLIDVLSMSCSEHFASCIRVLDRAVIIGERSPGYLLAANWVRLSNGAAFMHTIARPLTPEGTSIEGNGVKPDFLIELDRHDLVQGRDTQLEEAVAIIKRLQK